MPNKPLSIEEKRQVIYSSVLSFTSEASSLRHRVIDRLVVGALIGSTKVNPFRIGVIRQNLIAGKSHPLELRTEVIEESLERLIAAKRIEQTESVGRHTTYFLTEATAEQLADEENQVNILFRDAASRALANTEGVFNRDMAERIFRRFVLFAFARSGRIIAESIAGPLRAGDVIAVSDSKLAFEEAASGETLTGSQRESLEARCVGFLNSVDAADERLKFVVVQGYYLAQLLGVEENGFNPLVRETFAGSTLFLDTNVLMIGLLPSGVDENAFIEVLCVAQRAGIKLRVTRATLNELRNRLAFGGRELERIAAVIPAKLASRTTDPVILTFFDARLKNPDLTVAAFMAGLGSFEKTILSWGVVIEEQDVDALIAGRDIGDISKTFQDEATRVRGKPKHDAVLLHDVAHFCLIDDERKKGRDVWFLTRDRSLTSGAAILRPDELPFCLNQAAFLQSISPFIVTPSEELSFADVFASLMGDQFSPAGTLFDTTELLLLAEYNQDVLATPVDQLIEALDYVKSGLLHGRPYTKNDIPKVSLALRKFLTSDRETRIKALEVERARHEAIAAEERRQRTAIERERDQAIQREQASTAEFEIAKGDFESRESSLTQRVKAAEGGIEAARVKTERTKRNTRRWLGALGIAIGVIIARFQPNLIAWINSLFPNLKPHPLLAPFFVKAMGALIFAIPPVLVVKSERWTDSKSVPAFIVLIALAIVLFSLIDANALGTVSNLFGVATVGALILIAAISRQK